MSCELNEDVSCEDCTRNYCPDMVDDAFREWHDIFDEIRYLEDKLKEVYLKKDEWIENHGELLK